MSSKNWMLAGVIVPVVFVAGCLVAPPEAHVRPAPVLFAPPLPSVVVFDTEQPYYVQEGFHYHYQNDRWYYSRSRSGPWTSLPRDRYPREVRYHDGGRGHDTGPGLQVLIAPPLPSIVLFDTEPYYVQEGYHYHYQNNGWYYSRSRSGPWTSLPKDRYPREVRYKDGRHGDDKGHGPQLTHPITPDRHQEIKKPEHTFGSDRNRLESATGTQRKTPTPTVERHERIVTPIPDHRERVQSPQEHKVPVMPQPRHQDTVQPPKELQPAGTPFTRPPDTVQPPKTSGTPFGRRPENVQPSREQKTLVMPPARTPETVQSPKEIKPVVTQPVVRREVVDTPTRESRSLHSERIQSVNPPSIGRSGRAGVTPQMLPSQPVVESKEKTGKESDKKKEHSR